MESHKDHARFLMSPTRKEWHDPEIVLKNMGIDKGMTLVDLGSGPGFFTIPMAKITGEKGLVYAVDSNPTILDNLLETINQSGINKSIIKIVRSDVKHTGIPKNSADVAFFAKVLHDIEDEKAFLKEVRRICKPTASVVDVDWKKSPTECGPPLKIRLTEKEATQFLEERSFKVIKQMDAGPNHYELICKLIAQQ
jgi:ubiquinone/menaquinone biosynthesis C-methylase UbiE